MSEDNTNQLKECRDFIWQPTTIITCPHCNRTYLVTGDTFKIAGEVLGCSFCCQPFVLAGDIKTVQSEGEIVLTDKTKREMWLDKMFNTINKDPELRQLILSAFVASSRPHLAADHLTEARKILEEKHDIGMEILT